MWHTTNERVRWTEEGIHHISVMAFRAILGDGPFQVYSRDRVNGLVTIVAPWGGHLRYHPQFLESMA